MDYHSVFHFSHHLLNFLAITPAATTILFFIIIILFLISFLVAGSEVAFFSLTLKDINMLKTRQQPSYKRIVTLLENPKTLLASMLIANSLVNIGIILISNTLMNDWIGNLQLNTLLEFLIKVIVVTFLLVMFGEILPKVWATHHKIWFSSSSSLIIKIFHSLFFQFSNRMFLLSKYFYNSFH